MNFQIILEILDRFLKNPKASNVSKTKVKNSVKRSVTYTKFKDYLRIWLISQKPETKIVSKNQQKFILLLTFDQTMVFS